MKGALLVSPLPLLPLNHGAAERIFHVHRALATAFGCTLLAHHTARAQFEQARAAYVPRVRSLGFTSALAGMALRRRSRLAVSTQNLLLAREISRTTRMEDPRFVQSELLVYARYAALAARERAIPFVLGTHNVEFERLVDAGEVPASQQSAWKAFEVDVANEAALVTAVSATDKAKLESAGVHSRIVVTPNGVDTQEMEAARAHRASVRQKLGLSESAPLLVFHGSFSYAPNVEALRILRDDVLPSVRERRPGATLLAFGRGLRAERAPGFISLGELPRDDVATHIAAADMGVVPLVAGSGTRLKIAQYLGAGLPVVSTSIGAEGLGLRPHEARIVALDGAFVKSVIELLDSPDEAKMVGLAGQRFARENLDWNVALRPLVENLQKLGAAT